MIICGLPVNRSQQADESQSCRRVCDVGGQIGTFGNEPTRSRSIESVGPPQQQLMVCPGYGLAS
jgi:hypothetical protein